MIYLDHASTTYIYPNLIDTITFELKWSYGNPSNMYSYGERQKEAIEEARERIASVLNCNPNEIFFTSGSSEGNAWALNQGTKCLCSPYEHHNITNNPKSIKVDTDYLDRCLTMNYNMNNYYKKIYSEYVYSHMLVNNETGEIFLVDDLFERAKQLNMFTHCDMTQALGNISIKLHEHKYLDMATFSGHKIHAPKGVGFCYIREDKQEKIKPLLYGGIQEKGLRAGTENVPYIVALSYAVCQANKDKLRKWGHAIKLREATLDTLGKNGLVEGVDFLVNEGASNIPSILNLAFKGVEGESLMLALDNKQIYVGTGSACNTGEMEPSEVLLEMGVPNEFINGVIRMSFDLKNTKEEVIEATTELVKSYKEFIGE